MSKATVVADTHFEEVIISTGSRGAPEVKQACHKSAVGGFAHSHLTLCSRRHVTNCTHCLNSYPCIPAIPESVDWIQLPLCSDLLRLRIGSTRKTWCDQGMLACVPANHPLPSLGRLRYRSSTGLKLKRLNIRPRRPCGQHPHRRSIHPTGGRIPRHIVRIQPSG